MISPFALCARKRKVWIVPVAGPDVDVPPRDVDDPEDYGFLRAGILESVEPGDGSEIEHRRIVDEGYLESQVPEIGERHFDELKRYRAALKELSAERSGGTP